MSFSLCVRSFLLVACTGLAAVAAQDPAPPAPKGPDKEIAEKIAVLKAAVADNKFERDVEGVQAIDALLQKYEAAEAKDKASIVKAVEGVLSQGKLRPHTKTELYVGATEALGRFGAEGAKPLKEAYVNKRYPEKPDWVQLREKMLKNLGRTKDESMVKFLISEAVRSHEAALSAAAGEALGNFEESKEPVRKEIVAELLKKYGELAEKASQIGTNIDAQNANDRLAAIQDKWHATLAKLTRQNFTTFADWQKWHNKNKNAAW